MSKVERPFDHLTILDLSDYVGAYCTKLFANMGAKVIMIEPPSGFQLRRQSPFFQDKRDLESSLKYQYLGTDKLSITCDTSTLDGEEILKKLIRKSDIIISSYQTQVKVTYEQAKKWNPGIIWCSITPFGQGGPYENYKSDDLINMSMGGMTNLAGYPDSSPLQIYGEQSYYMASLFSAISIMVAYNAKEKTDEGEFIDVSIQDCVAMGTETAPQFYDMKNYIRERREPTREPGNGIYPCKDGYIMLSAGELGTKHGWKNLINWLEEENIHEIKESRWNDKEWKKTKEAREEFGKLFSKLSMNFTKNELYHEGQKRKIALGPVNNARDILENEHLEERNFFTSITTIDGKNVVGPGAPFRLSESPWTISKSAPRLGEHTVELLTLNGYENEEIDRLFEMGVI